MAASFQKLLREAVKHFTRFGFTSPADVNDWLTRLSVAAETSLDITAAQARIEKTLGAAFYRALAHGRLIKKNKGYVDKLFIAQLEPRLRDELERRMYAARELLEGDKKVALERIHQRFLGIATAGAQPKAVQESVRAITKAERDAKAHARMMAVDQTSKLMNMMDEVIAKDAGSIGGFWDATWDIERKHRPEHAARHDKWYPRQASWADDQGLLKRGNGWMHEHDMPGVLINCRCEYHYVYDLEDVPEQFLTPAGKAAA